ncbi:MAG: hypothetical protein KAR35_01445 [Candidatus Heimdallarchaeota archaeon]|nr:hypothetical protein [Candidatus Heimdallarchaeota archaeon]MCK5048020.1 hypothetical protein [Candidatus Heimdallarchaeota archaeon]
MSYEHKTYSEELIEIQHKFVTEITENWEGFGYPNPEQLKEGYERENFTPETRHYAFSEGKLVGFISSAKEREIDGIQYGSIQRPFILNEDPEVEAFLMKKAIAALKELGVEVIRTFHTEAWGSKEFLKRNGYDDGEAQLKMSSIAFKEMDFSDFSNPNNVKEVDLEADNEPLTKAFATEMPNTPEEISELISNWKDVPNIISNAIIREGDEIIAHSMVLSNPNNMNGFMSHISIYEKGKEELRHDVFKYLINKVKETDREVLNFNVNQDGFDVVPFYESKGMEFAVLKRYEKKI